MISGTIALSERVKAFLNFEENFSLSLTYILLKLERVGWLIC